MELIQRLDKPLSMVNHDTTVLVSISASESNDVNGVNDVSGDDDPRVAE